MVAPYIGAWIEILSYCANTIKILVAPYIGAWIEILLGLGSPDG